MRALLRKLSQKLVASEQDRLKYNKYEQMRHHEGWAMHVEILMYLRGLIAEDVLSESFTKLEPKEKDAQQRAYAMVSDVVLFLVDPLVEARKLQQIKNHNTRMEATVKGATRKG